MSNTYAILLFVIVVTSTSSTLCVSNGDNPEIFMVVDDQSTTTVHDSGMAMSKANPIQIGKFVLEDGKVLTLSRKTSPSRNCVGISQSCWGLNPCCEGLSCDGTFSGTCNVDPNCYAQGSQCALNSPPCCWPYMCSGYSSGNTCVPRYM